MGYLKTFIAPLLTRTGTPVRNAAGQPIFWLDELLAGGLYRPDGLLRPLVVLVAGPPGAGKSILIQQIFYENALRLMNERGGGVARRPLQSLLISTETPAGAIAAHMQSMGWLAGPDDRRLYHGECLQCDGSMLAMPLLPAGGQRPPMMIVSPSGPAQGWDPLSIGEAVRQSVNVYTRAAGAPALLAVDSLNVVGAELQRQIVVTHPRDGSQTMTQTERDGIGALYSRLVGRFDPTQPAPEYLFLIMDTPDFISPLAPEHAFWEYVADVIIRVGSKTDDGYFQRSFEVVKARFQPQTLGRQVMKIFPRPPLDPAPAFSVADGGAVLPPCLDTDPEGARPNLVRGGLFPFPSTHYILSKIRSRTPLVQLPRIDPSRYAFATPADPAVCGPNVPAPCGPTYGERERPRDPTQTHARAALGLRWPVPWSFELCGGTGVPLHSTTAIVGKRGMYKSYFGYQFLLDGIANGERTLTISFRDDPAGVLSTLNGLRVGRQYSAAVSEEQIQNLNLTIFQRPGFVTPDEFLHRVIEAVAEHQPSRVMINAVGQWDTAYPLLAKSPILLNALIDFLNVHAATSVGIGVEGGGFQCGGLTSKADTVLSFDLLEIPWDTLAEAPRTRASRGYAIDGYPTGTLLRLPPTAEHRGDVPTMQKVVVRAVRVPHGHSGLARAALEYQVVAENSPAGLRLVPLAPEYPPGKPL